MSSGTLNHCFIQQIRYDSVIIQRRLVNRRVQERTHNPVGESPTEDKRLDPRSLGGTVAGNQYGEALRQHFQYGRYAILQAATYSERRSSLVTRKPGGRDGR